MAGTKQQRLVELRDEIECRGCGAPTNGPAVCGLCFEAIIELRALAVDSDPRGRSRSHRAKAARPLAGSRRRS
jgi:hypothetical protein